MNSENINSSFSSGSDAISLKEVVLKMKEMFSYLFSKWMVIMLFGIIGACLGFAYTYSQKPIYTATTTFVLEDEGSGGGLGSLAGLASIAGVDLGGGGGGIFQGDNILGLYRSRSMLELTLLTEVDSIGKRQLLVDWYIDFNQLKKKWADRPELARLNFKKGSLNSGIMGSKSERIRDSILGTIVSDINKNYLVVAKPDKKLSAIQVDVKAQDEFFAKSFNDELVKNVNDFYISTKTKKTLRNVQILQHKTDSVRNAMNGAIYSAVAIADATPNLNPTRQVQRVAPAQRAQFSAETNKLILSEMAKTLEMTKMGLLRETPLIQVIDQPIFPLEKEKLGKVKGFIVGSIISSFLAIFFLLLRLFFTYIKNLS